MSGRLVVAIALLLGGGGLACGTDGGRPSQAGAAGAGGVAGAAASGGRGGAAGSGGAGHGGSETPAGGGGGAAGASSAAGAGGGSGGASAGAVGNGGSGGAAGAPGAGGAADAGDGGGAEHPPMDAGPDVPACTPATVGASCGTDMVCTASGDCVTCAAGRACMPANPCRIGTISCTTGVPRCETTTANQPNGTLCGTNLFCMNGFCSTDVLGPCTPSNPCHVGMISYATGAPVCQDTGALHPDGRSCGDNKVCMSGNCVACSSSGATCPGSADASAD